MRKYRVFISSTTLDLGDVRIHVADKLRKSGLDPVVMTDWPADSLNPAAISVKRTKGCDICVAIIGLRRGTIAIHDKQERSITQLEIDSASANRAKVLVFMLDNTAGVEKWPAHFIDHDDPLVSKWREELQRDYLCDRFIPGELPDVLPAVINQIMQLEALRRSRLTLIIGAILALIASIFALLLYSHFARANAISSLLRSDDPTVFNSSRTGYYTYARLIDGRSALHTETNFKSELSSTKKTFKMFANQFWTFEDNKKEVEAMLKNGAKVQLILSDYSEDNENLIEYYKATALKDPRENRVVNENSVARILDLFKKYPSQAELRLNRMPLLYTLWIKEEEEPNALANLGVYYYGGYDEYRYFRFSKITGGNTIDSLVSQFNYLWEKSAKIGPNGKAVK